MTEILAFDPARTNNAQAIRDAHDLGYLNGTVIDLTVGPAAGFWNLWRPDQLTTNDLDPTVPADRHQDVRVLWRRNEKAWDVAVFDPPYKLNGKSTGRGPSVSDRRYGVAGAYRPRNEVHDLLMEGTKAALKMARRHVLVKCQDQQSSGQFNFQTALVAAVANLNGGRVVTMLHVTGHRKQPGKQKTARQNYSTLVILEVKP